MVRCRLPRHDALGLLQRDVPVLGARFLRAPGRTHAARVRQHRVMRAAAYVMLSYLILGTQQLPSADAACGSAAAEGGARWALFRVQTCRGACQAGSSGCLHAALAGSSRRHNISLRPRCTCKRCGAPAVVGFAGKRQWMELLNVGRKGRDRVMRLEHGLQTARPQVLFLAGPDSWHVPRGGVTLQVLLFWTMQ